MNTIDKIKDFNTALPIVHAVRVPNTRKRNIALKRQVDLYLLGLLDDLGCFVTLSQIEYADTNADISSACYGWLNACVLGDGDRTIIKRVCEEYNESGLVSPYYAVDYALRGDSKSYIDLLNTYNVSQEYLALYHPDDIVTWDNGKIYSIERNEIIYK